MIATPLFRYTITGPGGTSTAYRNLVEDTGGNVDLDKLPVGDPTLSAKEIIGNESQERMGLVIGKADIDLLARIAERERSPMYEVGKVTGDDRFTFASKSNGEKPYGYEPLGYLWKFAKDRTGPIPPFKGYMTRWPIIWNSFMTISNRYCKLKP